MSKYAKQTYSVSATGHGFSDLVDKDARISSQSVFGEWVWDCRQTATSRVLEFCYVINWPSLFGDIINGHFPLAISIMEFAYSIYLNPISEDRSRSFSTVKRTVNLLAPFCRWILAREIYDPGQLEATDFFDYFRWLKQEKPNADIRNMEVHLAALRSYYRYSSRVSMPLLLNPFGGASISKALGQPALPRPLENLTPNIPPAIWAVHLRAALDYVDIYSQDILRARDFIERAREHFLSKYSVQAKAGTQFDCGTLGVHLRKEISNQSITALVPDCNVPWRGHWKNTADFRLDEEALFGACLWIVLSLSGMRESEVTSILNNGHHKCRTEDRVCEIFSVAGRVSKPPKNFETWVVNGPVFDALEVLKALTAYGRVGNEVKEAFVVNYSQSYSALFRPELVSPVGQGLLNDILNRFSRRITKLFSKLDRYPELEVQSWHFVTSQFRRTLAEHIATEPFGIIAGMIQYKHTKISTFEGYAGRDPSWGELINEQQELASEKLLMEIFHDVNDGAVSGKMASQLTNEIAGYIGDLKDNATAYFVENHRHNLHVGILNYCFFEPGSALCLRSKKDKSAPILHHCHPNVCANSCVTKKHLPAWKAQINDASGMLEHPGTSRIQKEILRKDIRIAIEVIKPLK